MSRRRLAAAGAVLVAALAALPGCSDDDGGDESGADAATSTTMAAGGIEVDAPGGWTAIPVPVLGFGLAVPPGWEAVRLDEQGLSSANQAEPAVPGFTAAAHGAVELGAVFYAAGVDGGGRVVDLTVEAFEGSNVGDGEALETLARTLADGRGWASPAFDVATDAAQPTVDVHFTAEGSRATPTTDDDPGQMHTVPVAGHERLILSPQGVVYSFVLTSEDAEAYDQLAAEILSTVAFPPA